MARLNIERQNELEPQRMVHARNQITGLGYAIVRESKTELVFEFKGREVHFFPYSGWHTGSTIKDGRGLSNLINQIKPL